MIYNSNLTIFIDLGSNYDWGEIFGFSCLDVKKQKTPKHIPYNFNLILILV